MVVLTFYWFVPCMHEILHAFRMNAINAKVLGPSLSKGPSVHFPFKCYYWDFGRSINSLQ